MFRKFPTIGSRTAGRFVYYLVNQPKSVADELVAAIQELKNSVKLCGLCFNPFEGDGQQCSICQSPTRSKNILCIVEKEADLNSIENTKKYSGLYFILGGTVSTFRPNATGLRLDALKNRVSKSQFSEIIIALNPTPEGKATSLLVQRSLKELSINNYQLSSFKITHLAQGIPVGGELEYTDEETLESAFEGRK